MGSKRSFKENTTRKEALANVKCADSRNSTNGNDRRQLLKGAALSVLSTLGILNGINTASAIPGENINVSEEVARKTISERRDRLNHASIHGVIYDVGVDEIVSNAKDSSSGEVRAKTIRDHQGNVQPAITVEIDGPEGEVTVGFPLRSDVVFFDFPDGVDDDSIASSWNDDVSTTDCPEGNDSCCCNVSSCDYCECGAYGYCDCTYVAGTECWYQYCDCCADGTNWCTRYCIEPAFNNC